MADTGIEVTHEATLKVELNTEEIRAVIHKMLVDKANYMKNHTPAYAHLPDVRADDLEIVNYYKSDRTSDRVNGSGVAVFGCFTKKL